MRCDGRGGIGIRVGEVDRLAAIAEGFAQHGKAGIGDELVTGEAQRLHREVFLRKAALGTGDFVRARIDAPGALLAQRQGRLRQDRRDHGMLGHHGESKAASKAHADRAHAASATIGMGLAGEGAEPIDDGAGLAVCPDVEFAAHADSPEHLAQCIGLRWYAAILAEQAGAIDRHPLRRNAVGKAQHLRVEIGDLVHDDDGGAAALSPDAARVGPVREIEGLVAGESFWIFHARLPPDTTRPGW